MFMFFCSLILLRKYKNQYHHDGVAEMYRIFFCLWRQQYGNFSFAFKIVYFKYTRRISLENMEVT